MITLNISGPLTMRTSLQHLALLDPLKDGTECTVDMKLVSEVDSSAVALLLHWLRHAGNHRLQVHFNAMPDALMQLLRVYSLADRVPLVAAAPQAHD